MSSGNVCCIACILGHDESCRASGRCCFQVLECLRERCAHSAPATNCVAGGKGVADTMWGMRRCQHTRSSSGVQRAGRSRRPQNSSGSRRGRRAEGCRHNRHNRCRGRGLFSMCMLSRQGGVIVAAVLWSTAVADSLTDSLGIGPGLSPRLIQWF
jgi:hypothetical protein